jgi:PAS domain S-box-containing protein
VKAPDLPAAETERLEALRRAAILDTPPEAAFDDMVRLARTVCQTPIAAVSLVDDRRAWFKAKLGLDVREIPRDISFCGHAVAASDLFVVPDASQDPRFSDNPLVTSLPWIRFYAGVPILCPDHHAIGTLCVLDTVPRELSEEQLAALRGLGRQVAVQIQFRRSVAEMTASVKEAWVARVQISIERALLRGVLQAATEYSIIGTDPSGTITVFNEGAERMLGYRAAEVVGRVTPELIHDPREMQRRAAELGVATGFEVFVAAARRGAPETREWTYVRKDGTRLPVSLTVTAMRDEGGPLAGFIGIARDITEERRAESERARFLVEQAARAAAERSVDRLSRLHTAASALADAITPAQVVDVIIHQGMAALGASAGLVALLDEGGQTLEIVEAVGLPAGAPRSFLLETASPITEAVQRGVPVLIEKVEAENGHQAVAAAPLLRAGRALGGLCFHFAESRSFEEEDRIFLLTLGRQCAQALERARLYEAAETANRAKDEFLSTLSHELRTPLTAVLGWVSILQSQRAPPEQLARGLAIIARNATAQLRLIEDIIDISRIVAGKLHIRREAVELSAVVRAAIDAAKPTAEASGLTLAAALDPTAGPMLGDADRLGQVIGNLLSNAVKFTPRGGRIDVRLERIGDQAQIRVADTGRGIPPDFLPQVFERFRQANSSSKRAHGGLGLGLSIARYLAELHGGTIVAESEGIGKGTTMTIRLPLAGDVAR